MCVCDLHVLLEHSFNIFHLTSHNFFFPCSMYFPQIIVYIFKNWHVVSSQKKFYSPQKWRKCFLSWSIFEQRNPTDFMMSFKGHRARWNKPRSARLQAWYGLSLWSLKRKHYYIVLRELMLCISLYFDSQWYFSRVTFLFLIQNSWWLAIF